MSREKTSKQADATGEADRTRQGQDVEAAGPRQPRPGRQNGSMCFFFLFVMFLYVVAIIGITVSAVSNDSFSKMGDGQSMGVSVTVDKSAMPKLDAWNLSLLAVTTLVGLGGAVIILVAARFFARVMAIMGYVMLLLACLGYFGFKVYLGLQGQTSAYIGAILPGIGAVLVALFLWKGRRQIRLASLMIQTASSIAFEHTSLYGVVFCSALLQLLAAASAVFGVFVVVLQFGEESLGLAAALVGFIVICWLWLSGTISNIANTTLAGGRFSEWFVTEDDAIVNTSTAALRASCTISLGSLAWNGLLSLLVKLFVAVLDAILSWIPGMGYVLDVLDSLVEMFNDYVCIVIGVNDFTIGYFEAAKKTFSFSKMRGTPPQGSVAVTRKERIWERSRQRAIQRAEKSGDELPYSGHFTHGIGAMVNYDVAGRALQFGALASAVIAAAVAAALVAALQATRNDRDNDMYLWEWVLPLWAFLIALLISLVVTSALKTGTSTLFVCFAHHNGAHIKKVLLQKSEPENMKHIRELHDRIEKYYPIMFASNRTEAKQIMSRINEKEHGEKA